MTGPDRRVLRVRVARRTAALERVLGRLRTLLRGVPDLTLARGAEGDHELRVTLPASRARPEQLRRELLSLHDVLETELLAPRAAGDGREMALVRLDGPADLPDDEGVSLRVLDESGTGVVVEVTGSGPRLDRLLSRWREEGRVRELTRTGEIGLPAGPEAELPVSS